MFYFNFKEKTMLFLTRRLHQKLVIDNDLTIKVININSSQVTIEIDTPTIAKKIATLTLARNSGGTLHITKDISVILLKIDSDRAIFSIKAPIDVLIYSEELHNKMNQNTELVLQGNCS
jgi:sRNA-binding carbon storage regulator CsrA